MDPINTAVPSNSSVNTSSAAQSTAISQALQETKSEFQQLLSYYIQSVATPSLSLGSTTDDSGLSGLSGLSGMSGLSGLSGMSGMSSLGSTGTMGDMGNMTSMLSTLLMFSMLEKLLSQQVAASQSSEASAASAAEQAVAATITATPSKAADPSAEQAQAASSTQATAHKKAKANNRKAAAYGAPPSFDMTLVDSPGSATDHSGPYGKPVDYVVVTQNANTHHPAIDYGVDVGTQAHATLDGEVVYAGWNDEGYGNLVVIQNGPWKVYYGHLSEIPVSVGQQVKYGDVIGLTGNTGNSTGPHLHYEVKLNDVPINLNNFTVNKETAHA
jgi:murein DD-endopeptidase MepM/ murein hydrolase activator NlpD